MTDRQHEHELLVGILVELRAIRELLEGDRPRERMRPVTPPDWPHYVRVLRTRARDYP